MSNADQTLRHLAFLSLATVLVIVAFTEPAAAQFAGLARFETPKKVAILAREFTIDDGELTPKLSVKRKVVMQSYAGLIDELQVATAARTSGVLIGSIAASSSPARRVRSRRRRISGGRVASARLITAPAVPLAWARVHVIPVDERCVPPLHADSNAALVTAITVIVVVGGGFTGLSAALHAAEAGLVEGGDELAAPVAGQRRLRRLPQRAHRQQQEAARVLEGVLHRAQPAVPHDGVRELGLDDLVVNA